VQERTPAGVLVNFESRSKDRVDFFMKSRIPSGAGVIF